MSKGAADRVPIELRRRDLVALTGLGAAGAARAAPAASIHARPPQQTRNVRDFGAKGDGVTDDTEAFNRATQADAEWSWDLLSSIVVPAGRYRLGGTVFLRKGQSLIGEGLSTYIDAAGAQRSTFVMGRSRDHRRGVEDPGGLPVRIQQLMGLGGAPSEGFIFAAIPGFQISSLFLTAVGLGIEVEAADGIISDIEIDQCLTAFLLRNSQNIVLTNLNLYLANYGISFASSCRDITISNSAFCYTKYASILLGDGAREINAVTVSGCNFTNNIPYETFAGYIYSRASLSDLLVTGCTFRNAPKYAVDQGAGTDLAMSIQGCVFDGQRTNSVYDQSAAPRGLHLRHGTFLVANSVFRRMPAEAIRVAKGVGSLTIEGGAFDGTSSNPILNDAGGDWSIRIRGATGLPKITSSPHEHLLALPWLGPRTCWQITAIADDPAASIGSALFLVRHSGGEIVAERAWTSKADRSGGEATARSAIRVVEGGGDIVTVRLATEVFGMRAPRLDVVGFA